MNTVRILLLSFLVVAPWNCPDAVVRTPRVVAQSRSAGVVRDRAASHRILCDGENR